MGEQDCFDCAHKSVCHLWKVVSKEGLEFFDYDSPDSKRHLTDLSTATAKWCKYYIYNQGGAE